MQFLEIMDRLENLHVKKLQLTEDLEKVDVEIKVVQKENFGTCDGETIDLIKVVNLVLSVTKLLKENK